MSERHKLGLRMVLWIARHLLDVDLTDEEKVALKQIATSLNVLREPAP
jgi:hypothetical protein